MNVQFLSYFEHEFKSIPIMLILADKSVKQWVYWINSFPVDGVRKNWNQKMEVGVFTTWVS